MKTGELLKRYVKLKPVTYVIPRNYIEPSKKSINEILKRFKMIMPNPNDFKVLLLMMSESLAGDSVKN
jgi:hypothetical protein